MNDKSLAHRLRTGTGNLYVADGEVAVINKNGRFHRLLGPGYYRLHPLSDHLVKIIKIAGRRLELRLVDVRARDGIAFTVTSIIMFSPDPHSFAKRANGTDRKGLLKFINLDESSYPSIVKSQAENSVRSVLGQYDAANLCSGAMHNTLQGEVSRFLKLSLIPLGFELMGDVSLNQITPPPELERALQAGLGWQELAHALRAIPEHLRPQVFKADFIRHMNQSDNYLNIFANLDHMPWADHSATAQNAGTGHAAYRRSASQQAPFFNQ